jgi:hypothetical protein
MIFSAGGSYIMKLNGAFEYQALSYREQIPVSPFMRNPCVILNNDIDRKVALFSVLFCANIVVGNAALRYVAVSLVQVGTNALFSKK